MEHRRENKSLGDKSVPRTNPTRIDLGLNFGLRAERTVTKSLSRGTVLRVSMLYHITGNKLKSIGCYDHKTSHMPEKIQLEVTRKFICALVNVFRVSRTKRLVITYETPCNYRCKLTID